MRGIRLFFICGLLWAIVPTSGCRQADPLDSETAVGLLKDRNTEPIKLVFSASPPISAEGRAVEAYDRLIDAHVLTCSATQAMGKICQPGPAGDVLTQEGTSELSLTAGRWVPATILSISRSGDSSAAAEVRMKFEPSPLYRDFETAFDQIQLGTGSSGASVADYKKEGKIVHAMYQRSDDGWRLESLN